MEEAEEKDEEENEVADEEEVEKEVTDGRVMPRRRMAN